MSVRVNFDIVVDVLMGDVLVVKSTWVDGCELVDTIFG